MSTMTAPSELLRNEPVQKRSASRLDSLIDAGWQVLLRVGRDRLTTALVAERAGCSIGTFYRYFPDRVALLDVLLQVTTLEHLQELPPKSVVQHEYSSRVFWIEPSSPESLAPRRWQAPGYEQSTATWGDRDLIEWAPLRILHIGEGR